MAIAVRYLLDTNTFSYIATGKSRAARARLVGLGNHEEACLSSITEAEVRFGLAKRARAYELRPGIEGLLSKLPVLPWGSPEAGVYGDLRRELEAHGKPLGNMDLLIAAHTIAARAVLVTNDKAFARLPNLPMENWATDL